MNSCLITLKPLTDDESLSGYSRAGLRQLTGSTKVSMTLPFSRMAFFTEQPLRQQGMSISGYQPKLSLCIAYFGLSGHLFRFHPARRFGVIRPA